MQKVVMYATGWCGYCARARALLESKNVSFEEIVLATGRLTPVALERLQRFCERNHMPLRRFRVELLDDAAVPADREKTIEPRTDLIGAALAPLQRAQ